MRLLAGLLFFSWIGLAFPQALSGNQLAEELRKGGYVLYIRHTSTDFSQNDSKMKDWEDCANQRNLTDKGREEAREIARNLKRLAIPVGHVHASPYCRTMETARLAFGKAEATQEARGGPVQTSDPVRYDPLRKLLGTSPKAKTNDVISSHGNPFRAVAPAESYLAEGEIAVVRPGGSSFTVVARLRVEDWAALR